MIESRWKGVPDTAEARSVLNGLAGDDCDWALVDAALTEIDRLRDEMEDVRIALIEARNPDIDTAKVREDRRARLAAKADEMRALVVGSLTPAEYATLAAEVDMEDGL